MLKSSKFVTLYSERWESYKESAHYINIACDYLNRQLKQKSNPYLNNPKDKLLRLNIKAHAYLIWQTQVFGYLKTNHDNLVVHRILDLIRAHRDGHAIPEEDVKKCIESFGIGF